MAARVSKNSADTTNTYAAPQTTLAPTWGTDGASTQYPHAVLTAYGWRAVFPGGSLGFFDSEASAVRAAHHHRAGGAPEH